jgi:cell division protein FtsX
MNALQYREGMSWKINQLKKDIRELINNLAEIKSWAIKAKEEVLEELKNQKKEVNKK